MIFTPEEFTALIRQTVIETTIQYLKLSKITAFEGNAEDDNGDEEVDDNGDEEV